MDFALQPPGETPPIRRKEPLYSMLVEASPASLEYLHRSLLDYRDDAALDDWFPEVGLTRRTFLEQVLLARRDRGM